MNKTLNILMSALLIAALDLSAKKIIIENDEGASIYYTITRGNASVTSSDGTPYSGDIKLPEYVEYEGDHYKVTRIRPMHSKTAPTSHQYPCLNH